MLPGHAGNEKACYNHVGHLYNPEHTLMHVLWPPVIPSTENSFHAFSRPIDSHKLPRPVLLDVETNDKFMLRAPMMCEKNPPPTTIPPFTLDAFIDAIQPLVDALLTAIPDGIEVDHLIGIVVGQAFGDGDARYGTKVAFHDLDLHGMNFYKHYVKMMNGTDNDIHLSYSEGCISVKLIGRPGMIINDVLTRLQYYAAYKFFPLSLIDVFAANVENPRIVRYMQGFFAGSINTDGSGSNNFVSFGQSQWWHGDYVFGLKRFAELLGIPIRRGYAREGPPLDCNLYRASINIIFERCEQMRQLARLITRGPKRDAANMPNIGPVPIEPIAPVAPVTLVAPVTPIATEENIAHNDLDVPISFAFSGQKLLNFDVISPFSESQHRSTDAMTSAVSDVIEKFATRRAIHASGKSGKGILVRKTPSRGESPRDENDSKRRRVHTLPRSATEWWK
jgi:hypothetical protein